MFPPSGPSTVPARAPSCALLFYCDSTITDAIEALRLKRLQRSARELLRRIQAEERKAKLMKEMEYLKASCNKLKYLLQTGRSTPAVRKKLTSLVNHVQEYVSVKELDLLRKQDDFTPLYLRFCELIAQQEDTTEIVRDLRKMVKDELERAKEQLEGFGVLKGQYAQDRQDLVAFFQDNVDAAKKARFPEGASSTEQSQQILDEMDNIDKSLSKIGDILKDNKEFWEGVDRRLKSAPPPPSGLLGNGPPEGITSGPTEERLEPHAKRIHTRLQTVNSAAAQYCGSHKMLKMGKALIQDASKLNRSYSKILSTQSSVETQLQSSSCIPKHRRKVLRPLTTGLFSLVHGYEKLTRRFAEYWGYISLLFWYAGSSLEEKLGSRSFLFYFIFWRLMTSISESGPMQPFRSNKPHAGGPVSLRPSIRVCLHDDPPPASRDD
ncbi:hypothetical protein B0H19DRAFT_479929 [Mycena capillaripes]|nr:hypothetical protein B0H19DRAFT_479929 [Mycena capillaripes]